MKNILYKLFFIIFLFAINSCENDVVKTTPTANGFSVSTVNPPSTQTISFTNRTDPFNKISWTPVDNGVSSVPTYKIQIADHVKDPNFLNPAEYSGAGIIAKDRTCNLTNLEINNLLNTLPTFNCGQMNIDIRVKSMLGNNENNSFNQYSNAINFLLTGYTTQKLQLAFVKVGETALNSSKLKSSAFNNNSNYEGYAYLTAGDYKFYQPDACGDFTTPLIYGGIANVLTSGSTSNIVVPLTGHYLINANLSGAIKTYSLKYFKAFGLFGTAKGVSGSGNAVPMIDAENNNVWKLTISLANGRIYKFKSQNWTAALSGTPLAIPSGDPNTTIISTLGTSPEPNGLQEVATGGDISVPGTTGSGSTLFDIVIDVSNPRKYTYTATKK